MILRSLIICCVLGILTGVSAAAETLKFELDPGKSAIEFGFAATLHKVDGHLAARQGTIEVDPATGEARGWILLDAGSAFTDNRRRDRKMHEKILESPRFPDIVYSIDRVSGGIRTVGRSELQLHGTLEFHGVKRPFSVIAVALSDGKRLTATGSVEVPYLEWGLKDPSFFLLRVAKKVTVRLNVSGTLTTVP